MKVFFLLSLMFVAVTGSCSVACPTFSLTITSQADIDQFATTYPGCTSIDVDIFISGPAIINLHGLSHLREFLGDLSISGTSITSLDGLDSLYIERLIIHNNALIQDLTSLLTAHSIQAIDIAFNPALSNLSGLDSLKVVRSIFLSGNGQLTDVDGLKNIRVITGNCSFNNNGNNRLPAFVSLDSIYGSLAISKNKFLINLRGLDSLEYIGQDIFIAENDGLLLLTGLENLPAAYRLIISGNRKLINLLAFSSISEITNELFVSGNHSLTDLRGLDSIKLIGEDCTISGINLITLNGLNNIDIIRGAFTLNYNYKLTDANAIKDLEHIGADFRFFRNDLIQQLSIFEKLVYIKGDIFIQDNANLSSLHSFLHLRAIDGTLHISGNPMLNSLEGIDFINSGTIQNVEIYENESLSICHVASLCYYFLYDRPFTIHDNQAGCNSMEEINAQCVVATNDLSKEFLVFHPNPTTALIQLENEINYDRIIIYHSSGDVADGWMIDNSSIDVSNLPAGFYIIQVLENGAWKTGKILKL